MSPNPFVRKIVYLAIFAVLAFPLIWLGAPSTIKTINSEVKDGGKLAQLRSEYGLGQSDLGAIDPASETIRLATLGLRSVAVSALWTQANEYKKTENWTAFQSTLEQLARLQPYFVKVWQYQAWNLSYNVSVERDDVRDRFYYVKQGIEYLEDGIRYLRDNPYLLDDLGWFTGNKVGRADEHEQYRRLFKADEDLHPADRDPTQRDNWLVSKLWYDEAIAAVDDRGQSLGQKNPTTFYDSPARSQISYAEAIEEEGVFGERAKRAWKEGAELWNTYGDREMPASDGVMIRLNEYDGVQKELAELRKQFDDLSPAVEEKVRQEAMAALSEDARKLWETQPAEPTREQSDLISKAADANDVTMDEMATQIAMEHPEKASQAQRLAKRIAETQHRSSLIATNKDVANYDYWKIRADLEQTPEALDARQRAHDAQRLFKKEADLAGAKKLYEESFDAWAQALKQFPQLPADSTTGSDLMEFVDEYSEVLKQLDLSLADKEVADRFALWEIVEANDGERKYMAAIQAHKSGESSAPAGDGSEPSKSLINPADVQP